MDRNLPDGCVAKFDHIVGLYNTESTMSLKKAHRLTSATLARKKNIEKSQFGWLLETCNSNNNNDDRLTVFDPGQPG